MEEFEYSGVTLKRWQVGSSVFTAMPEVGARLLSWDVTVAGNKREVVYWPYNTDEMDRPAKVRGGNPILFPFAARTFDKGQIGFWRYKGERRKMQMHGYTRDGKFDITRIDDSGFRADFVPCDESNEAYPFKYTFSVEYRFKELSLEVDFILKNNDSEPIPWCPGHHFYFKLPWQEGLSRSDYEINLPAKKAYYQSGDGKLEPVKDFEQITSFDDPGLSDRIHSHLKSNQVLFGPKNSEENIVIRVCKEPVPPSGSTIVVWTEKDDSPFYCVEPWMGPPNSPEHKIGLQMVEPGETDTYSVEIALA